MLQVVKEVVGILNADTQPDEVLWKTTSRTGGCIDRSVAGGVPR
jgi:hypothetical protein